MYTILGVIGALILIVVNVFAGISLLRKGKIWITLIMAFAVLFLSIFSIASTETCICIRDYIYFRRMTVFFMEYIFGSVLQIFGVIVLVLAIRSFFLGVGMLASRIFWESFWNLLIASLWANICVALIVFYICPMICGNFVDFATANEQIWTAIRQWFGII